MDPWCDTVSHQILTFEVIAIMLHSNREGGGVYVLRTDATLQQHGLSLSVLYSAPSGFSYGFASLAE